MPRPRHSPPACLQGRVFTTAEAEAAGVAKRHLSGRQYCSWGKGLWSCADSRPDPRTRSGLLRILPALQQEGWAASHTTAAILHDFRLPGRLGHVGGIHLCSSTGSRPRGRGVVGHRSQFHAEDLWTDGSVRITSPARTLLDLAASTDARGRHVMTHQQLVTVIDGVICEHRTGISRGMPALRNQRDLSTDLERFESHRGVRRVRQALLRAVVGVDSPLETYTRLVLEDHRFTGWEADVEIRSPGGRRVHPDLADRHPGAGTSASGPGAGARRALTSRRPSARSREGTRATRFRRGKTFVASPQRQFLRAGARGATEAGRAARGCHDGRHEREPRRDVEP